MAYIQATSHTIPLVLQIAEDGHAQVYANVLHLALGSTYLQFIMKQRCCQSEVRLIGPFYS
jgi:hypothetical protein